MIKKLLFPFLLCLILSGCANDSPDDLIEVPQGNITYTGNIQQIIASNCYYCHGSTPQNGAPMSMTSYEAVKEAVMNRNLIGKISKQNGEDGLMPLGGPRLPQATIDQIIAWRDANFAE
ncbi:MAG: c-type cytochrome [Flavobacterium sp.]|nr:c-type cytochrome [Flavobacterium sp.]